MDNVIDFEERRNDRLKIECDKLRNEFEMLMFLLDPKFRAKQLVKYHPIPTSYREKGKRFATNTPRENIFKTIKNVEGWGWTDLEIEKTAIYGTPNGVEILSGDFAIYGIPPSINKSV